MRDAVRRVAEGTGSLFLGGILRRHLIDTSHRTIGVGLDGQQ